MIGSTVAEVQSVTRGRRLSPNFDAGKWLMARSIGHGAPQHPKWTMRSRFENAWNQASSGTDLHDAFLDALRHLSPRIETPKAIPFGARGATSLTCFLEFARFKIDDLIANHSLRSGGERAVAIYTVLETCNGVNPKAHIMDVIHRAADVRPASRLD